MNVYVIDQHAFVPHPGLQGMWIRTHRSAAFARCPQCKAEIGEPCRGQRERRWLVEAHYTRKDGIKCMDDIPVAGVIVVADPNKVEWVGDEKPTCKHDWQWTVIQGTRVFREVERDGRMGTQRLYDVKCGICGLKSVVDETGEEVS